MLKHVDLFSGIGGFALAARSCGIETVAFCEISSKARTRLSQAFPNIPIHEDVRNTDEFAQYKDDTFLLTGGYPCQPFSVAGNKRGEEDARHLWPQMLNIVKLIRPTWVLAENVAGHIKLGLDKVLFDLESEGYAARSIVVPACAKDAPHRRDRVWIVANSCSQRFRRRSGGGEAGHLLSDEEQHIQEDQPEGDERVDRLSSSYPADHGEIPYYSRLRGVSSLGDWARLGHGLQPLVLRGDDELPDWMDRIEMLGNAIDPAVAAEIMSAILLTNDHLLPPLD